MSALKKDFNWKKIGRIIRLIIPLLILYFIFRSIDFNRLTLSLVNANAWFVLLGLAHMPIMVLVAAQRWRFLLNRNQERNASLRFILSHYWIGMAVGFFSPAGVGMEGYRVAVSGRRFGGYTLNAGIILSEKIVALFTCVLLISLLYPVSPITITSDIEKVLRLSYVLLIAGILVVLSLLVTRSSQFMLRIEGRVETYINGILEKISQKFGKYSIDGSHEISINNILKPLRDIKQIGIMLCFSFFVQFISAIKSQIFFCSLNYDLPFIANMFAIPVLFLIFNLPISLGGLGIREGAFIVIYGLFGVPMELALLISFFNLFGVIINNAIGGVIMIFNAAERNGRQPV